MVEHRGLGGSYRSAETIQPTDSKIPRHGQGRLGTSAKAGQRACRRADPTWSSASKIQELLGHKSLDSVQRDTRVTTHDFRRAVKRLRHLPGAPRTPVVVAE